MGASSRQEARRTRGAGSELLQRLGGARGGDRLVVPLFQRLQLDAGLDASVVHWAQLDLPPREHASEGSAGFFQPAFVDTLLDARRSPRGGLAPVADQIR